MRSSHASLVLLAAATVVLTQPAIAQPAGAPASSTPVATQPPAATPPAPRPVPPRVMEWADVGRYAAANAALTPPAPGRPRVVFMGDSITQGWAEKRPGFFDANGYVGRGIGGQTTAQMVLRFHQDVVSLKPAVVLILAGTNDVAENAGPMSDAQILDNVMAMVEMAQANGIASVVGSIPPATTFFWRKEMTPAARIKGLNARIRAWAEGRKIVYADFWTAMALADGGMNTEYADDTVHPNDAGYAVMEPIARKAIAEALAQR